MHGSGKSHVLLLRSRLSLLFFESQKEAKLRLCKYAVSHNRSTTEVVASQNPVVGPGKFLEADPDHNAHRQTFAFFATIQRPQPTSIVCVAIKGSTSWFEMIFSMYTTAIPPPVRNTGSELQNNEGYPPLTSPGLFPPFLMPGQYYPAPGQYWPPYPYYPTPSSVVVLGKPGPPVLQPNISYTAPQSSYGSKFAMPQAYSAPGRHQDPLVYLGAAIADPATPLVTKKQLDYDPWKDYNAVMRAIAIGAPDPEYCQSFSSY